MMNGYERAKFMAAIYTLGKYCDTDDEDDLFYDVCYSVSRFEWWRCNYNLYEELRERDAWYVIYKQVLCTVDYDDADNVIGVR